MKILFFAQSRHAAGRGEWQFAPDRSLTPAEFWATLVETFPGLAPFQKSARLARRETYLGPDDRLEPHDEIALIPPVSGG